MNWMIHDGELVKRKEGWLPIDSRPVAYGDGCFDTLRSYQGKFLEFDKHVERLHSAMEYLGLTIPDDLDASSLKNQIDQLLRKNELTGNDSMIRIQVWREGSLGYTPEEDENLGWAIVARELPEMSDSLSLSPVPTRRIPSNALNASYKLSNGLNYIRASIEARVQNADDALMLTVNDYVSETTIANIFWAEDTAIYTPNLECDILPGITRSILSHLIRAETDYKLVKGKFEMQELLNAEAVWVCNSLREIVPVKSVEDTSFDTEHDVTKTLRQAFDDYKEENLISVAG